MLNYIKKLFANNKELLAMEEYNEYLFEELEKSQTRNELLQEEFKQVIEYSNGEKLLSKFLNRLPKYVEVELLSESERNAYYQEAKNLLRNKVLMNEITAIVDDFKEEIALRAQNFQEVEALRMSINGLQLIVERLEYVQKPDSDDETKEDLYGGI